MAQLHRITPKTIPSCLMASQGSNDVLGQHQIVPKENVGVTPSATSTQHLVVTKGFVGATPSFALGEHKMAPKNKPKFALRQVLSPNPKNPIACSIRQTRELNPSLPWLRFSHCHGGPVESVALSEFDLHKEACHPLEKTREN